MQILAQAVKLIGLVFPSLDPGADQPGAHGGDGAERVDVNGEDGANADCVRNTGAEGSRTPSGTELPSGELLPPAATPSAGAGSAPGALPPPPPAPLR